MGATNYEELAEAPDPFEATPTRAVDDVMEAPDPFGDTGAAAPEDVAEAPDPFATGPSERDLKDFARMADIVQGGQAAQALTDRQKASEATEKQTRRRRSQTIAGDKFSAAIADDLVVEAQADRAPDKTNELQWEWDEVHEVLSDPDSDMDEKSAAIQAFVTKWRPELLGDTREDVGLDRGPMAGIQAIADTIDKYLARPTRATIGALAAREDEYPEDMGFAERWTREFGTAPFQDVTAKLPFLEALPESIVEQADKGDLPAGRDVIEDMAALFGAEDPVAAADEVGRAAGSAMGAMGQTASTVLPNWLAPDIDEQTYDESMAVAGPVAADIGALVAFDPLNLADIPTKAAIGTRATLKMTDTGLEAFDAAVAARAAEMGSDVDDPVAHALAYEEIGEEYVNAADVAFRTDVPLQGAESVEAHANLRRLSDLAYEEEALEAAARAQGFDAPELPGQPPPVTVVSKPSAKKEFMNLETGEIEKKFPVVFEPEVPVSVEDAADYLWARAVKEAADNGEVVTEARISHRALSIAEDGSLQVDMRPSTVSFDTRKATEADDLLHAKDAAGTRMARRLVEKYKGNRLAGTVARVLRSFERGLTYNRVQPRSVRRMGRLDDASMDKRVEVRTPVIPESLRHPAKFKWFAERDKMLRRNAAIARQRAAKVWSRIEEFAQDDSELDAWSQFLERGYLDLVGEEHIELVMAVRALDDSIDAVMDGRVAANSVQGRRARAAVRRLAQENEVFTGLMRELDAFAAGKAVRHDRLRAMRGRVNLLRRAEEGRIRARVKDATETRVAQETTPLLREIERIKRKGDLGKRDELAISRLRQAVQTLRQTIRNEGKQALEAALGEAGELSPAQLATRESEALTAAAKAAAEGPEATRLLGELEAVAPNPKLGRAYHQMLLSRAVAWGKANKKNPEVFLKRLRIRGAKNKDEVFGRLITEVDPDLKPVKVVGGHKGKGKGSGLPWYWAFGLGVVDDLEDLAAGIFRKDRVKKVRRVEVEGSATPTGAKVTIGRVLDAWKQHRETDLRFQAASRRATRAHREAHEVGVELGEALGVRHRVGWSVAPTPVVTSRRGPVFLLDDALAKELASNGVDLKRIKANGTTMAYYSVPAKGDAARLWRKHKAKRRAGVAAGKAQAAAFRDFRRSLKKIDTLEARAWGNVRDTEGVSAAEVAAEARRMKPPKGEESEWLRFIERLDERARQPGESIDPQPHVPRHPKEVASLKRQVARGEMMRSRRARRTAQADPGVAFARAMEEGGLDVLESRVYRGGSAGALQKRYRKNEQLGFGFHFTPDRRLAGRYADPTDLGRGKDLEVLGAELRMDSPLRANRIVWEGDPEWPLVQALTRRKKPGVPQDGRHGVFLQNAIDSTSPQRAERLLKEAGYDSVIYEAQVSRRGIGGVYNDGPPVETYVVFEPHQVLGGATKADHLDTTQGLIVFGEEEKALIFIFESATPDTIGHELGHFFRQDLEPKLLERAAAWAEEASGFKRLADGSWSIGMEEAFAEAFSLYLKEGLAPNKYLREAFSRFKQWIKEILSPLVATGKLTEVDPEIREVFDIALGEGGEALRRIADDLGYELRPNKEVETELRAIRRDSGVRLKVAAASAKREREVFRQAELGHLLKGVSPDEKRRIELMAADPRLHSREAMERAMKGVPEEQRKRISEIAAFVREYQRDVLKRLQGAGFMRSFSEDEFLRRNLVGEYLPHIIEAASRARVEAMLGGNAGYPRGVVKDPIKHRVRRGLLEDVEAEAIRETAAAVVGHRALQGELGIDAQRAARRGEIALQEELGDQWGDLIQQVLDQPGFIDDYRVYTLDGETMFRRYFTSKEPAIASAEYIRDMRAMFPEAQVLATRLRAQGADESLVMFNMQKHGYAPLSPMDRLSSTLDVRLPTKITISGKSQHLEGWISSQLGAGVSPGDIIKTMEEAGVRPAGLGERHLKVFSDKPVYLPEPVVEYLHWTRSEEFGETWSRFFGLYDGFHSLGKVMATISSLAHIGRNGVGNESAMLLQNGPAIFNPVTRVKGIGIALADQLPGWLATKKVRLGNREMSLREWRHWMEEQGFLDVSVRSSDFHAEQTGGIAIDPSKGREMGLQLVGAGLGAGLGGVLGGIPGAALGGWGGQAIGEAVAMGARKTAQLQQKEFNDVVRGFRSLIEAPDRSTIAKGFSVGGTKVAVGAAAGIIASSFDDEDEYTAAVLGAMLGGLSGTAMLRMMSGLNEALEGQARASVALHRLSKGDPAPVALERVNEALRDYSDLTHLEREGLRRAFFFYTWEAGNLRFVLKLMKEKPQTWKLLSSFVNVLYKGQFTEDEINALPEPLRWTMVVKLGEHRIMAIRGLPTESPAELLRVNRRGVPVGMVSRLNPAILNLIEWWGGNSLFWEKPIGEITNAQQFKDGPPLLKKLLGVPDEPTHVPVYDKDGEQIGTREDWRSSAPETMYWATKVPGWRLVHEYNKLVAETYMPRAMQAGVAESKASDLDRVLNYAFGQKVAHFDPESQAGYLRYILTRRLMEAVKREFPHAVKERMMTQEDLSMDPDPVFANPDLEAERSLRRE